MKAIQLNFINQSNDINNSPVVIIQKNVASSYDELAVAWTVIKNCGPGGNHPFTFPWVMQVCASDSYGNYTPQLDATPGQLFQVSRTASGDTLVAHGSASVPSETQVSNSLPTGAINASIYKDGKLLATKTSVVPGQMAAFQFKPTIWIGVASQIVQGTVINSAIVAQINTELSLLGVASADIVMTGGGPGQGSTPFQFSSQNVVMV